MLGYLILLLIFFLFLSLSFSFGAQEWFRPRDASPLPVDVEYVRVENYFGVSFREKMQDWLQTARALPVPESTKLPIRSVLETPEGEKILILSGGRLGSHQEAEEIIYSEEGLLFVEPQSCFRGQIYVRGKLESGVGVRLRAVVADGDVILGEHNTVAHWIDAQGRILLRKGTTVASRVSSSECIEMESQVSAQSLYAPLVFTAGYRHSSCSIAGDILATPSVSVLPYQSTNPSEMPAVLKGTRCTRLAMDTWLVQGDLRLPPYSRVESKLVIHGALQSEPDCYLGGDIKAHCIEFGARNRVLGNVISESEVGVGESSFMGRNLVAETDIVLRSGARIGRPEVFVAVSAGRQIRLESDVAVYGKLAAGYSVLTL
ncbi:MAG: hypothetical protein HY313_00910 [Acidobacteria bacterium]|nr:hypothetical protein [Acidobacteriota bacterium]